MAELVLHPDFEFWVSVIVAGILFVVLWSTDRSALTHKPEKEKNRMSKHKITQHKNAVCLTVEDKGVEVSVTMFVSPTNMVPMVSGLLQSAVTKVATWVSINPTARNAMPEVTETGGSVGSEDNGEASLL